MTDKRFNPGDVVRLKSGGYQMTICGPTKDGRYTCDWHSKRGEGWQGYYVAEQLEFIQVNPLGPMTDSERVTIKTMENIIPSAFKSIKDTFNREMPPAPIVEWEKGFESIDGVETQDSFDRRTEMPPAPPSGQEDMGPTKTDGTSRNVAPVQLEKNDK